LADRIEVRTLNKGLAKVAILCSADKFDPKFATASKSKGDHLDAEQKIRLGGLWASKAGNNYRYFMVYERRTVDGAYKLEDFLNIIKDI